MRWSRVRVPPGSPNQSLCLPLIRVIPTRCLSAILPPMDQTWRMDLRGFSAHVVIVFLAGTAPAAIGQDASMTRADATFVQAIAKADRAALERLLDADFTWTN